MGEGKSFLLDGLEAASCHTMQSPDRALASPVDMEPPAALAFSFHSWEQVPAAPGISLRRRMLMFSYLHPGRIKAYHGMQLYQSMCKDGLWETK